MCAENEGAEYATNYKRVDPGDGTEQRSLGTDMAQTFLLGAAGGAGGYVGLTGAKNLIGAVGDAIKGEPEPPSQVVIPDTVHKE